jgi:hypothetical protein
MECFLSSHCHLLHFFFVFMFWRNKDQKGIIVQFGILIQMKESRHPVFKLLQMPDLWSCSVFFLIPREHRVRIFVCPSMPWLMDMPLIFLHPLVQSCLHSFCIQEDELVYSYTSSNILSCNAILSNHSIQIKLIIRNIVTSQGTLK